MAGSDGCWDYMLNHLIEALEHFNLIKIAEFASIPLLLIDISLYLHLELIHPRLFRTNSKCKLHSITSDFADIISQEIPVSLESSLRKHNH
jgi:hypothetical protein